MKQLKRIGLTLCAIGMVIVLALTALRYAIVERSAETIMIGGGVAFFVGVMIWMTSSLIRLLNGQVKLRPFDALKLSAMYFAVFAAVRLGAWAVFPEMERDFLKALFLSIAPALALGFYFTAYRKPA